MAERIVGSVLLFIAGFIAIHATVGRMVGRHRSIEWRGGGAMTLVAELAIAGFFASVGSGFVTASPLFVLTGLFFALIAGMSQLRANRRQRVEDEQRRTNNAKQYPGVFDSQPPLTIDCAAYEFVDVYDCDDCVYLGRIASQRIQELIHATESIPDQGPNDIFVIEEMLEPPSMQEPTELKALLHDQLVLRGSVMLRWIPVLGPSGDQVL